MLLHLVLISYFAQGISSRNVIEYASLTYCDKKELSKSLVDGVLKINYAEVAYERCPESSSIELLFQTSFSIHYILVYEGANNGSSRGGLDYFTVEQKNSSGKTFPCSMYPYTSAGPLSKKSMRVNCIVNPANKIIIKSRMVLGISIAKIEAHTLIESGKDILTIYHGCFDKFSSDKQTKLTSWSDCLNQCAKEDYVFAAIKNNEECHCGEIPHTAKTLPVVYCDISCGTNFCGGLKTFSIYIVNIQLPYFNGCFAKSKILNGYTINGDMTVSKCVQRCYNHTFAALTKGYECLCVDEDFPLTFDNYYSCNVKCSGELSKTCGGENHFSLYGTKSTKRSVKWLNIFRCKLTWNEFGKCGRCEADYLTRYCTTIDTKDMEATDSTTTPTLIEMTTSSEKADQTTSSILVEPKFQRLIQASDLVNVTPEALAQQTLTVGKADESVNFCASGKECKDELNTECISRKKAFECICLLGYYKGEDKVCTDVNECEFPMCDPSTTTCENTIGSYLCMCKPGHFRIASHICLSNVSEPLLFALDGDGISMFFIILGLCGFFVIAIMICAMAPPVTEDETEMPAPSPIEDDVPSN